MVSAIGVSTYCFGPDCDVTWAVDFAVRHGFRAVELGSYRLWPERLTAEEIAYLKTMGASHGIEYSIHLIHRDFAPASHNPERRAQHLGELESTARLAYDLGARVIVMHPGPVDCPDADAHPLKESHRIEALGFLDGFLRQAVPSLEATGTVLCVENLPYSPSAAVQSYEELVHLVRKAGSPLVRVTLDTGHAYVTGSLGDALKAFSPYLRHVHVHGVDGEEEHLEIIRESRYLAEHVGKLSAFPHTLVLEVRDYDDMEGCVLRSRDSLEAILEL